ncbi:hypothetical protein BZ13_1592 [Francisella philomiragia subsp. philomiragia ATCC 25015]|uniref:hypothetical protein n=1 Tax=Francisella philomiragia TaxID=28110 RepID=UPI0001AF7939|nr:hypothetical protein [Francisella philomiragia]AJI75316.1 hypothetical protein BZ13_1592 [Francisella philomiragia subsp. philomiragia ATCC 25015]EET20224.1 predicted protein [Francisella philomiragia subsp. philomiragia ATCC 25015]MBK2237268.1 hypothetical protein [Francisella philomiragia]
MNTTLQNQPNNLKCSISGVTTQVQSSINTAHKISIKSNGNISNGCNCISNQYTLSQLIYWYVNLYIINSLLALAKLFCLVGRNGEYKSQFIGKYPLLGSVLVVNLPDYLTNKTEEQKPC